ncbi:MAG: hypothetical protein K8I27_03800 [Planctomycetes bacterium]|nr:hypothetical protein [Planctomycetota bacterium]
MDAKIDRAKEIAQGIEAGTVWVDAELANEMATVIRSLTTALQDQRNCMKGVEFALSYYSEPDLYVELAAPAQVILDGGLRARTALGMLKAASHQRRANSHTYGELS